MTKLEDFLAITATDQLTAERFLDMAGDDLQLAIEFFYENGGISLEEHSNQARNPPPAQPARTYARTGGGGGYTGGGGAYTGGGGAYTGGGGAYTGGGFNYGGGFGQQNHDDTPAFQVPAFQGGFGQNKVDADSASYSDSDEGVAHITPIRKTPAPIAPQAADPVKLAQPASPVKTGIPSLNFPPPEPYRPAAPTWNLIPKTDFSYPGQAVTKVYIPAKEEGNLITLTVPLSSTIRELRNFCIQARTDLFGLKISISTVNPITLLDNDLGTVTSEHLQDQTLQIDLV